MLKPILFNTNEVQATLDGRKTVMRRDPFHFSMKTLYNPDWSGYSLGEYYTGHIETGVCLYSRGAHDVWGVRSNVVKPRYQVGDILWVRETFAVGKVDCGEEPDGRDSECYISQCEGENDIIPKEWAIRNGIGIEDVVWKPSIFMPKESSRIFLNVTDVRVERLKDMKTDDVVKEGVYNENELHYYGAAKTELAFDFWIDAWNTTIHKKHFEKLCWEANPWVFVYEFERCENA